MFTQLIKLSAGLLVVSTLSGCAKSTQGAKNSFCLIYEPIYMSVHDTEETKRQIDLNNAAFEELCSD